MGLIYNDYDPSEFEESPFYEKVEWEFKGLKEKQDKLNYFFLTEQRITRQDNLFDFGYFEE